MTWGAGETLAIKVSESDLKMDGVESGGEPGGVVGGTKGDPGGGGLTVTPMDTAGDGERSRFSPQVELNWGVPRPSTNPSTSSTGNSRAPVTCMTGRLGPKTSSSRPSTATSSTCTSSVSPKFLSSDIDKYQVELLFSILYNISYV